MTAVPTLLGRGSAHRRAAPATCAGLPQPLQHVTARLRPRILQHIVASANPTGKGSPEDPDSRAREAEFRSAGGDPDLQDSLAAHIQREVGKERVNEYADEGEAAIIEAAEQVGSAPPTRCSLWGQMPISLSLLLGRAS